MSVDEHKMSAPEAVSCCVVTVSDTRTEESDKSGKLIKQYLQEHGHLLRRYEIIKDDAFLIGNVLDEVSRDPNIDAILLSGGTGIAKRDVTYETVAAKLEKEIVGFGELFRMLSYTEDIGSAAMLSRAIAGVVHNTAVFSLPGSSGAVKLAMTKLILPELTHVVREIKKP